MKKATISQTKNQLSALLDQVKNGETILITDRGRPVARLEPVIGDPKSDDDTRLARLERAGMIRRGHGRAVEVILNEPLARPRKGGDILKALLDERAEGR